MACQRWSFTLPIRSSPNPFRLYLCLRQQLRSSHAGFANRQDDPQPYKHMPNKTKKPIERQARHEQKAGAKRLRRQLRFSRTPQPISSPTVQETKPTEPYFVRRTPTRNLPVYEALKRGGNLKQTKIRKIEGERAQLTKQLEASLDPKPEWLRVNPTTGNIEMKVRLACARR